MAVLARVAVDALIGMSAALITLVAVLEHLARPGALRRALWGQQPRRPETPAQAWDQLGAAADAAHIAITGLLAKIDRGDEHG